MIVIGLDIGGANIKAVKVECYRDEVKVLSILREYFPLWIYGRKGLEDKLKEIKESIVGNEKYYVSICMTAELSDVYRVKKDGVEHIVKLSMDIFNNAIDIGFVSTDKTLVSGNEAIDNYLKVAGANWAASAWFLERYSKRWGVENSVFIDIGSTTATLIPIINGKTCIRGFTDPEKLTVGELIYTGVLRSNVVGIVSKIPLKGLYTRICNEKFALIGDIHLVLGNISSNEYTTETADGRGKSVDEAMERIARIPCGDKLMINSFEIKEIARYVYESQIYMVFEALMQIRSYIASLGLDPSIFKAIIAGIGKFLAREAAIRAGFKTIIDIDYIVGSQISSIFPAYAAAMMMCEKRCFDNEDCG